MKIQLEWSGKDESSPGGVRQTVDEVALALEAEHVDGGWIKARYGIGRQATTG